MAKKSRLNLGGVFRLSSNQRNEFIQQKRCRRSNSKYGIEAQSICWWSSLWFSSCDAFGRQPKKATLFDKYQELIESLWSEKYWMNSLLWRIELLHNGLQWDIPCLLHTTWNIHCVLLLDKHTQFIFKSVIIQQKISAADRSTSCLIVCSGVACPSIHTSKRYSCCTLYTINEYYYRNKSTTQKQKCVAFAH